MDDALITLENAAKLAGEKGLSRFTRFLDPAQCVLAGQLAHKHGARFSSFGGYDDAERRVGCFHPVDLDIRHCEYPIVCLHSRYSTKFCTISHRDLLGSFMALGLTRSCIGDIIIVGADVYLFADAQTSDYIVASMTSAGKASLDFRVLDETPPMPKLEGESFSCIVSALRLDALLAGAYRLSRNEAQELIRSGAVKVNHLICEHVDVQLKENTLLSVRGKGRIRLLSIDGFTKKQRIVVTFFRYV